MKKTIGVEFKVLPLVIHLAKLWLLDAGLFIIHVNDFEYLSFNLRCFSLSFLFIFFSLLQIVLIFWHLDCSFQFLVLLAVFKLSRQLRLQLLLVNHSPEGCFSLMRCLDGSVLYVKNFTTFLIVCIVIISCVDQQIGIKNWIPMILMDAYFWVMQHEKGILRLWIKIWCLLGFYKWGIYQFFDCLGF